MTYFLKHIVIDILCVIIMSVLCRGLRLASLSYFSWFILAIKAGTICLIVTIAINFIFYKKYMTEILDKVIRKGREK